MSQETNTIAADYGRFLAALMKKDLGNSTGIDYIAVGSGSENEEEFKSRIEKFFNDGTGEPLIEDEEKWWVWAKLINKDNITYLGEDDNEIENDMEITNKLKIEVTIEENEPSEETFDFFEFALVGVGKADDDSLITSKMFLINHVSHEQITKDNSMKLTRTIKLTFPINNEEENNE